MSEVDVVEVFRRVASEVEEKDFSAIEPSTKVSELGIDSIAMMEIIGCIEEELEVLLPEQSLARIQTVGDIAAAIREALEA